MVEARSGIIARCLARLLGWMRSRAAAAHIVADASQQPPQFLDAPAPAAREVTSPRFHLPARLCSAAKLNRPKRNVVARAKRQRAETRHVWLRVRHAAPTTRPNAVVLPFAAKRRPRLAASPLKRAA